MYNKKMNFFSKANIKIFSFLARNPTKKMYGREIARKTRMSAGATNQSLNYLLKMGFLRREKKGDIYFYWAEPDTPATKQFKIFLTVFELMPLIERIGPKSDKIMLFGSCADGTDTENSDLDLFVLSEERDAVGDGVKKFARNYPKKIQVLIRNYSEWLQYKTKEKPFYERVNRGILLWRKKE